MTKFHSLLKVLAILVVVLATASIASAQATGTWVSGVGDDVNPCSRTAPCKTFAGAISKTAANGEIRVLDPGGFGAVNITKSITIDGTGTLASALNPSTNGIIVNGAGIVVRIRNLTINGAGSGINGIRGITFGKLYIENCVIFGQSQSAASRGIKIEGGSQVFVKDTNIGNSASGIEISSAALVSFSLDNVRVEGMTDGIILGSNANGAIRNSYISLNSGVGVKVTASTANFELENCEIQQNGTGVSPANGGTVVFSNTSVFGNTIGVATVAGSILTSHGNNQFTLNGGGSVPTSIGQQ